MASKSSKYICICTLPLACPATNISFGRKSSTSVIFTSISVFTSTHNFPNGSFTIPFPCIDDARVCAKKLLIFTSDCALFCISKCKSASKFRGSMVYGNSAYLPIPSFSTTWASTTGNKVSLYTPCACTSRLNTPSALIPSKLLKKQGGTKANTSLIFHSCSPSFISISMVSPACAQPSIATSN